MPPYGSSWTRLPRRRRPRAGIGRPKRPVRKPPRIQPAKPAYAPKPPAAAPAPPKPLAPQPLPFDPIYQGDTSLAQRSYANTQAGLDYQRLRTRQEYGIDDPSDPFSKAASLKRNYEQGQRRTLNTAGTNLYSSAGQRNLDEGTRGYNQAYSGMRRAYDDTLFGITQQENEAKLARDAAFQAALAGRLDRVPRPEDPAPTEPGPAYRPRNSRGVGKGWWVATAGPNKGGRFRVERRPDGSVFHVYASGKRVRINNPYG